MAARGILSLITDITFSSTSLPAIITIYLTGQNIWFSLDIGKAEGYSSVCVPDGRTYNNIGILYKYKHVNKLMNNGPQDGGIQV